MSDVHCSGCAVLSDKVAALEAQNKVLEEDLDSCAATLAQVREDLARCLEANRVSVHRASQMATRAQAAEGALAECRRTKENPR